MDAQHLRPIVLRILESAGDLAARERASRIGERHVARAFLATPSMAHTLLTDQGIDLDKLGHTLERWEEEEEQVEDASTLADINRVKERLEERLVGQNDAIQQILPYVQRMRFGFTVPTRPVGVFLFCGPSGSGKTETAKELARAVYGSEENLIFLEMGQFNAPESMNIFVGAPHGYVGYGEGKLTNGLRDHPRAVVLFDEIEKADPKVQDALLRFIDEGQLSDPSGPVRDGTQCIVVLTSNISAKQIGQLVAKLAQDPGRRTEIRKELRAEFEKHFFRVEFLNRVDEIVMFHALEEKDYIEISSRSILRNLERLRDEHGIQIDLDEAVCQLIGKHCAVLDEGARAAERLTQAVVITPVIDFVLRHQPAPPIRLKVTAQGAPGNPAIQPKGRVELAR